MLLCGLRRPSSLLNTTFRDWIVGDSQRMCAQFPPCNDRIHLSQEPPRQVVRITKDTRGLYAAESYVRMRNGTSLG